MNKIESKRKVKRTNVLIETLQTLDSTRGQITAVMDALTEDAFTLDQTSRVLISASNKLLKLSSRIRPHTVEGNEKRRVRNLQAKFRKHLEKNEKNICWVEENCELPPKDAYGWFAKYSCRSPLGVLPDSLTPPKLRKNDFAWGPGFFVTPSKTWLEKHDK